MSDTASLAALRAAQPHVAWGAPAVAGIVKRLDDGYPGGLVQYVANGRRLLAPSAPGAPSGERRNPQPPPHLAYAPDPADPAQAQRREALEARGLTLAATRTAFVLVAGGLGERLGFSGIKLALPVVGTPATAEDTHTMAAPSGSDSERTAARPNPHCFLAHYAAWLLQLNGAAAVAAAGKDAAGCGPEFPATAAAATAQPHPPLVIMTSDDTHSRTEALLAANGHFGLRDVTLLRQDTVPCFSDCGATLATDPATGALVLKPHGHGDVHLLLHRSRLLQHWRDARRALEPALPDVEYVVFMQDTNAAATTTVPLSLAMADQERWALSMTCVPRRPGESIGALMEVDRVPLPSVTSDASDTPSRRVTCCVEYNVLSSLLQAEGLPGDAAAPGGGGFSAYPGSINTIVVRATAYEEALARTRGVVAEFINPKYADATRSTFKSAARLETLMQDIALELRVGACAAAASSPASAPSPSCDNKGEDTINAAEGAISGSAVAATSPENAAATCSATVGGVVFDRRLYHPMKNATNDGVRGWATAGLAAHTAASSEANIYTQHRMLLHAMGASLPTACLRDGGDPIPPKFAHIGADQDDLKGAIAPVLVHDVLPVSLFPVVYLHPGSFVPALAALRPRFPCPERVRVSPRSVLLLSGRSIVVESLDLDGAFQLCVEGDDACAPAGPSFRRVTLRAGSICNAGWTAAALSPEDAATADETTRMRGFRYVAAATEQLVLRCPPALAGAAVVVLPRGDVLSEGASVVGRSQSLVAVVEEAPPVCITRSRM